MPPKSRGRGRPRGSVRGRGRLRKLPEANSEESESNDAASDNSSTMSVKKAKKKPLVKAPAMEPRFPRPTGVEAGTPILRRSLRRSSTRASRDAVPEILQEMVAEVAEPIPERPLKKRKLKGRGTSTTENSEVARSSLPRDQGSSVQFEEITSPKSKQTFFKESDDESDENDLTWEDVDVEPEEDLVDAPSVPLPGPSNSTLQDLELDLTINTKVPQIDRKVARRKAVTKEETRLRISIHKMHILCLLAHIEIRNSWCNDPQVHDILRPKLSASMMKFFKPEAGSAAGKMSRIDSIKAGLNFANYYWYSNFKITERGMRRALWADREENLQHFDLPEDGDSVHDKEDFRAAAKAMKGSRDVGAQLYCAFLRCAGLDVRLVCSLQPLSWKRTNDEPSMPVTPVSKRGLKTLQSDQNEAPVGGGSLPSPIGGNTSSGSESMPLAARRRLGNASIPIHNNSTHSNSATKSAGKKTALKESPYPIYWVEVLSDSSTTPWIPVDPLVLKNIGKRLEFEPPLSDKENSMKYVVAFEDDGRAREVIRRYSKVFNSKTRKLRVESVEGGDKWWKKTMGHFSRGFISGVDDVEHLELARYEVQEPMPKSIMDFKDHPVYALERHLKRNEVLVSRREIGKVAAGVKVEPSAGASAAKKKKLESVYRRSDVKIAKSSDGWYRIGREIKMGEQPVKVVPARSRADDDMELDAGEGEIRERAGVGLYTEGQTEVYEPPPVVNGRVPTNSYGNLDIYVPSMVPRGGVHIPDSEAKLAARIVGVHSADAVTGFEFRGRHGTAVIRGVVVATEFQEAIEAVIQGIRDEQQNAEDERRTYVALRMWKKFMIAVRVKERIAGYEIEGEKDDDSMDLDDVVDDDSGMESEEYVDDGAGGFFPE